jgi:hypothetical protein
MDEYKETAAWNFKMIKVIKKLEMN